MELVLNNSELIFCDFRGKDKLANGHASFGVLIGKEDATLLKENGARINTHPSGESWVKVWIPSGQTVHVSDNVDTADVTIFCYKWAVGTHSGTKVYMKDLKIHK